MRKNLLIKHLLILLKGFIIVVAIPFSFVIIVLLFEKFPIKMTLIGLPIFCYLIGACFESTRKLK